jgi:hypothetical protein
MLTQPLSSRDIEEIISTCLSEPGLRARRDAALFAVVWCGQLSIPEAVRVSVESAKRIVSPCGKSFTLAVQAWAELRPAVEGPLLLTINRQGRIQAAAMPATTASEVIRRRAAEAKVGYVTPQELLRASVLASRQGRHQPSSGAAAGSCDVVG